SLHARPARRAPDAPEAAPWGCQAAGFRAAEIVCPVLWPGSASGGTDRP
nr:hypothetical protein [Tanacetum cinerariifolium]